MQSLNFTTLLFLMLGVVGVYNVIGFSIASATSPGSPGILKRGESLNPNGTYFLEWEVNFSTQVIIFNATVQTTGFVGFGLTDIWGMLESDLIVGGIWPNGTTYFSDRHGVYWGRPPVDAIQNWNLLSASENSTHTHLSFYRLLDTGDVDDDYAITNNTINLVWSFGETDNLVYHGPNRGLHPANLLDP